jgi:hypothetical protein
MEFIKFFLALMIKLMIAALGSQTVADTEHILLVKMQNDELVIEQIWMNDNDSVTISDPDILSVCIPTMDDDGHTVIRVTLKDEPVKIVNLVDGWKINEKSYPDMPAS